MGYDNWPNGTVVASGTSSINQTVSLANWEGEHLPIELHAKDSASQTTMVSHHVWVDSTPKLEEIITMQGYILDFDAKRILYRGQDSKTIYFYDRTTNQSMELPTGGQASMYGARLIPTGVIGWRMDGLQGQVFEWKGGQPIDVGSIGNGFMGIVQGSYALWNDGMNLIRRDTTNGSNIIVTMGADSEFDMAENGDVVYLSTAPPGEIFRYKDGITEQISQGSPMSSLRFPMTDGINVVYGRYSTEWSVMLFGTSGEATLAQIPPLLPPASNYVSWRVSAGYVAFTRMGGGALQVWVRDPGGQETQLSIWGTDTVTEAVQSAGEVMFINGFYPDAKRYRASAANPIPEQIDEAAGNAVWKCGRWYIPVGRTLFGIIGETEDPACGGGGSGAGGSGGSGAATSSGAGGTGASGSTTSSGAGGSGASGSTTSSGAGGAAGGSTATSSGVTGSGASPGNGGSHSGGCDLAGSRNTPSPRPTFIVLGLIAAVVRRRITVRRTADLSPPANGKRMTTARDRRGNPSGQP